MDRRNLKMAVGITVVILWIASISVTAWGADITLKLGHPAPPGPNTHNVSANKLTELIATNTSGKVEVKVFGNSQFGSIQEHFAQIKTGAIDLFLEDACVGYLAEPEPKNFMVVMFPYVFDSQDQVRKFYHSELFKSMVAKIEKAAEAKFIGYLGDRGSRGFSTTNKRIATPDEIKGLKLRVPPVPPFVAAYKSWGAAPTPVDAKDVYTGVKSGMVEGMDMDMTTLYASKWYEIQKYYVALDYMRSGLGCYISIKRWNSLSQDIQAAILKSAQQTETYLNEFTVQQISDAEKGLTQAGVEIIRPDLKPWKELAEKEVRNNEGKLYEAGLYDKIKAMK
jgi:TRAP-type C4-dicarboxylate transport system substrate-binding protein